jgi:protein-disulfide isomerase
MSMSPRLSAAWAAILVAALGVTACGPKAAPKPGVEELRAVLAEHPELVLEVLDKNRGPLLEIMERGVADRRQQGEELRLRAELANPFKPEIDPRRPVLGKPTAPVTVVEYTDFLCPYCGEGDQTVLALQKKHAERIRVVLKHIPLHDGSQGLALLFEAVAGLNPDKAWKFKDLLFADQKRLAEAPGKVADEILRALGLDVKRVRKAAADPALLERVESDRREAKTFGLRGTPMFLINGVGVRGAYPLEYFERVLSLVEGRAAPPPAGKGRGCGE